MLSTIKSMLDIQGTDLDGKLTTIIDMTESRLRVLLGGVKSVPDVLDYVIMEVAIKRFNRVGSEGLASHSVEGESMAWEEDDFKPFLGDIQDYLSTLDEPSTYKGRVKFI
jgi:hypothetical protein